MKKKYKISKGKQQMSHLEPSLIFWDWI